MTSDRLVGTLLDDRYRVEARIASGGMSTVYRGLDHSTRPPGRAESDGGPLRRRQPVP